MSKTDWDMKDFEKPESKDVLKKTSKGAPKKDEGLTGGRVSTFMGAKRKQELVKEAHELGMPLATLIRMKINKKL